MIKNRYHVMIGDKEEKVSSSLFGARLACACLNDMGIAKESLSIIDDFGVSYSLVGCR